MDGPEFVVWDLVGREGGVEGECEENLVARWVVEENEQRAGAFRRSKTLWLLFYLERRESPVWSQLL